MTNPKSPTYWREEKRNQLESEIAEAEAIAEEMASHIAAIKASGDIYTATLRDYEQRRADGMSDEELKTESERAFKHFIAAHKRESPFTDHKRAVWFAIEALLADTTSLSDAAEASTDREGLNATEQLLVRGQREIANLDTKQLEEFVQYTAKIPADTTVLKHAQTGEEITVASLHKLFADELRARTKPQA